MIVNKKQSKMVSFEEEIVLKETGELSRKLFYIFLGRAAQDAWLALF